MRANGFELPSGWAIKWQLIQGPFPVQFDLPRMDTQRFCAGAYDAFERCLGRR
ncbi:MAG: hypothetical protein ABIR96_04920 [Bdellovibrionota bacterium]